jgi:hypothetical protein
MSDSGDNYEGLGFFFLLLFVIVPLSYYHGSPETRATILILGLVVAGFLLFCLVCTIALHHPSRSDYEEID